MKTPFLKLPHKTREGRMDVDALPQPPAYLPYLKTRHWQTKTAWPRLVPTCECGRPSKPRVVHSPHKWFL